MSNLKMPEPIKKVLSRRLEIVDELSRIVPADAVVWHENEMRVFETDGLTAYKQLPMVVVLPETTEHVIEVLKYCHRQGIRVVPRGAGTCAKRWTAGASKCRLSKISMILYPMFSTNRINLP